MGMGESTHDAPDGTPGVEGAIVEGAEIVIHALDGEDFGDQGPPADQVFDRFLGKQPGDPRDPNTAEIGAWAQYGYGFVDALHQDYVGTHALSGDASFQGFTQGTQGASLRANPLHLVAGAGVREAFMSANMLVPPGGWGDPSEQYIDAEGWPTASFAKMFWMMDGPSGGSVAGAWDMLAFGILDGSFLTPASGNESVLNSRGAEEFPRWPTALSVSIPQLWGDDQWHLMQYGFTEPEQTHGSSPAAFRRLTRQDGATVYAELDTWGQYEPFAPGVSAAFDRIAFPGYLRDQDPMTPPASRRQIYLDDVYIALGPGALCRVEVHDTEDDADANVVAVVPVVAGDWSPESIRVVVRLNDLVPSDPSGWWLKVFAADGQRVTARRIGG